MEVVGAAASVIAVVELVGKVSASAASFMRNVQDARKDMIHVRKDMSDLSTVLRMVAEDLDHDRSLPDDSLHSQRHIVCIAHSCRTVLLEIETILQGSRTRIGWVTAGKERVDRLRERLDTCKLSLDIALDYRTMIVVHDIKDDNTRLVGDLSAIQRDMALLLAKVENIEQKALRSQSSPNDTDFPVGSFMLDRFINECRSEAQTVLDSIEWEEDQDPENVSLQQQVEVPEPAPEPAPDPGPELEPQSIKSSPSPTVRLNNSLGHVHEIDLEKCRTVAQVDEIIKHIFPYDPVAMEEIEHGRYTLYQDDHAIPPESWGDLFGPGLSFDLKLWKYDSIKFRDPVGSDFDCPWDLIKTWQDIEDVVRKACLHLEDFGPLVQKGHYDLVGPDDTVVLPTAWEQIIRPGRSITVKMWPLEQSQRASKQAGRLRKKFMVRRMVDGVMGVALRRAKGKLLGSP